MGGGLEGYCGGVEVGRGLRGIGWMRVRREEDKEVEGEGWFWESSLFGMFGGKLVMGEEGYRGLEKGKNGYMCWKVVEVGGEEIMGKRLWWKEYGEFDVRVVGVFEGFGENRDVGEMDVVIGVGRMGEVGYDGRKKWLGNEG